MADFSKFYLTTKGEALVAKIIAGEASLVFTKVCTSSKTYPEAQLPSLEALDQIRQTSSVNRVTVTNGTSVKVETAFTNQALAAGYYLRSLGLYATDPDVGEILYGVCVETSGYCYMPAYNGVTVSSAYIQIYTTVGNSDDVDLSVYSGAYATVEDIEELEKEIADLRGFVGYSDNDIYGVEVDFPNKKFTRLAGAVGKSAGSAFDSIKAFGGRKRCIMTADGVVLAYQGDNAFTTGGALIEAVEKGGITYPIGTLVQVMVEQPKFYYKVVPLSLIEVFDADGNHQGWKTKKIRYYVSDVPKKGFKIHPQFTMNEAKTVDDYIYKSAFDGCLYDVSESAYILDDAQVADFTVSTGDKLCSIADAKPVSGLTQNLTRANARKLTHNMGNGWELENAITLAGTQILMLIECASFNSQSEIGNGIVNKTDDGSTNMAELTGATVSLGNASGEAENANHYKAVSYRGEENIWGNIWDWEDGVNIKNPSSFAAGMFGIVYAADHAFADDTGAAPYEDTGIRVPYGAGYVSAFGYSEKYDYLFVAVEFGGNSSLPVGDYGYNESSGWYVAISGGHWSYSSTAGVFYRYWSNSSSSRLRSLSARTVYLPKRKAELDAA